MARVESEGGMLALALEEGERLRIVAGSHVLLVSRGSDGTLTSTLRTGGSEAPAAQDAPVPERAPLGIGTPSPEETPAEGAPENALTAPDAILEILNIFQQVNVRSRRAKQQHDQDSPEHASAVGTLKAEAMDRVVDVCQRYARARARAAEE